MSDSICDDSSLIRSIHDWYNNSSEKNKVRDFININKIYYDALLQNKILLFSAIPMLIGYYLRNTVFIRSLSTITSDLPKFTKDIDIQKVLLVLLPYIIAMILFYVSNIATTKSATRIDLMVLQNVTDQILESIKTSKDTVNINEIILHLKKLSDNQAFYRIILASIAQTIIVAFGVIYNFSQCDTSYTFLVLLIIMCVMIITIITEIDNIEYAHQTEKVTNTLYDEIHETLINLDSVLTSNMHENEINKISQVKSNVYDKSCDSIINTNNTSYILLMINLASIIFINYISYRLYADKKTDITMFTSTILMSLMYMDYYSYSIYVIEGGINNIGKYEENQDYFKMFKIIKQGIDNNRTLNLTVTNGEIQLNNLSAKYGNTVIFNKLSLKIPSNKIVGLVGSIGSGKTILLKILAGITDYDGDVLIDSQNLKLCTYESIVNNIGYVSQHPKLFNKSIFYNLNYGSSYTKSEIIEQISKLGIKDFIESFPNGYDTIVGKEGLKVSEGQRKFIAIIRMIIQNKKILLLDEPSSSLDIKAKNMMMHLINKIKNNKTIIVSTHDRQLMDMFDLTIKIFD